MPAVANAVTEIPEGVIIRVMVTTGSKHPCVFTAYNSWRKALHCSLGAPAIGGKANRELIERCAIFFKVAPHMIHIIEGQRSTMKRILIRGRTGSETIRILSIHLEK